MKTRQMKVRDVVEEAVTRPTRHRKSVPGLTATISAADTCGPSKRTLFGPSTFKVKQCRKTVNAFFVRNSLNKVARRDWWVSIIAVVTVSCGQVVLPDSEIAATPSLPALPAPEAAKTSIDSAYYVVKPGDTLYSIGFRSGHGYQTLAAWNDIKPPYKILVGQKLKMFAPGPEKPTIIKPSKGPGGLTQAPVEKRNSSQKKSIVSNDKKKLLKLYWQWPITGTILKNFARSGNKGIDISGRLGQPVKAAEAGKVVYSGTGLIGYGNLLIVKHNETYMSAYANNSLLLVVEGDYVKKGQKIAEVGKSALGQAALHFEIRKNGNPVNPLDYLPKN